jgi:HSP20 family molecular chaperone IbpA
LNTRKEAIMAETHDVATRQSDALQREARRPEIVLRPATDIFEDDDAITLQMDLPGASKDRLTLQVNRDRLDLEAEMHIDMPEGMEAVYADVRSTRYQRTFNLSGELESDAIEANLKDGVLTLRIPKRPEVRPRKIEVRAA